MYSIVESDKFYQKIGGLITSEYTNGQKLETVGDINQFEKMVKRVKVLANSTTLSKDSLVSGLVQLKHVVAVAADNTNDCKILAKAHVSIGLGSDSEVVQCMCSILLKKDDINNLVDLIMFSRNIFVFIRKYFLMIFIAATVILLLLLFSVLTN